MRYYAASFRHWPMAKILLVPKALHALPLVVFTMV
jgi:hypothetical protein